MEISACSCGIFQKMQDLGPIWKPKMAENRKEGRFLRKIKRATNDGSPSVGIVTKLSCRILDFAVRQCRDWY